MEYSALEIATLLGGEVEGDPNAKVSNLSKIEEGKPLTLSFMANPRYEEYVYTTEASVVIVNRTFVPSRPVKTTLIRVDDAYQAFTKLLHSYNGKNGHHVVGVQPQSFVSSDAQLGADVYVGAFAYIGKDVKIGRNTKIHPGVYVGDHVTIGDDCILHPGVRVYQHCQIGNRCIFHGNAVIGADGFGFAKRKDGSYEKIPQTGNVIIEDDVEIGACTTIDSATLGSTFIRKGAKIDNLVQIAHNVDIGEHTAIAALVGISGSTKIGSRCTIAGQVGIVGHIEIADDIIIGAQAGVTRSFTTPGITILGGPATEVAEAKRILIATRRLPDMADKIARLQAEINELRKLLGDKS